MNRMCTALSMLLIAVLQPSAEGSTADIREHVADMIQGKSPPRVRPDGPKPVEINVGYSPLRFLDLDMQRGRVRATGYLSMHWTDPRLRYDQAFNVTNIHLDPDIIWTPDMELPDTDSPGMEILNRKMDVIVTSDGSVTWIPHVTFPIFCDDQWENGTLQCSFRLFSWTYNGFELTLVDQTTVDLNMFKPIKGWSLQEASVQLDVIYYPCCPEPYPTLTYTFTFAPTAP